MTGLENIINEIMQDAHKSAALKLDDAKKEAREIIDQAKVTAKSRSLDIEYETAEGCKNIVERGKSACELDHRKRMLSEKQAIIAAMLDKALQSLKNKPDDEYFDLISQMIKKYALNQKGEVAFSKKDKSRLPSDFAQKLDKISEGMLKISEQTRNIDGGFVLIYGGIEENCSFSAMFASANEELSDSVRKMLF